MMESWYDDAKSSLQATVTSVEKKDDSILVGVSGSNFYPGGGGQPADTGRMLAEGFEGDIIDTVEGELLVRPRKGVLEEGVQVELVRDENRRNALMRMHTGEHIFFKSLQTILPELRVVKIDLGMDESKLFVTGIAVEWKHIFEAERIANKIIAENREISERVYSKEEALALEGLRIRPERIPGNEVRVIRVKDFDISACKGVHAHSTGPIGCVMATSLSCGANESEIRFITGSILPILAYAGVAREMATTLGVAVEQSPELLVKRLAEIDAMKGQIRAMAAKVNFESQQVGEREMRWLVSEHMDARQLTDAVNREVTQDGIACAISVSAEKSTLVLASGEKSNVDASALLQSVMTGLGGKGGGREHFAMGSCKRSSSEILDALKTKLT